MYVTKYMQLLTEGYCILTFPGVKFSDVIDNCLCCLPTYMSSDLFQEETDSVLGSRQHSHCVYFPLSFCLLYFVWMIWVTTVSNGSVSSAIAIPM